MTDRAKFELLATSVLRKANPLYAPIIHTGVNAQGETIVSPLDGIHLIPGSSPPHYVFAQHTTYDRSKLHGKWLTARDADLPKAIAEAAIIRKQFPDARFTVVLCTNQRADVDLVRDVTVEAARAGLEVDFWEQHRLADFLDNSGDGHWLRKKFLGVEAELLSEDLLRQLCRLSIDAYRGRVLPAGGQLLRRETATEVLHTADESRVTLCLLTGSSGFGKSVTALQGLEQRLSEDGFGLWLPPERMQDAARLEGALDGWLRHLYPSLEARAGAAALRLALARGQKLLVVVDDVSRTEAPVKTLRTLVALAAPPSTDTGAGKGGVASTPSTASPAVIVSPIWPEWLQHLPDKILEAGWIRTIPIGALTTAEGSALIRLAAPSVSSTDAAGFAERLANDPFAVGLFATLCRGESDTARLVSLAEDVIAEFIDTQLQEITALPGRFLFTELRDTLIRLGQEMLRRRNLLPRWPEVSAWFGGAGLTLDMLRAILSQGSLARLLDDTVIFRHDRLRDWLLAEGMNRFLQGASSPDEVIADPYFAGITGQALARDESLSAWIERLFVASPLSLFEAVRHFRMPRNEHQRKIADAVRRWAATEGQAAVPMLRGAVSWTLLETDSPLVVELVSSMPKNLILPLAALRNGSAKLGLANFTRDAHDDFEPGIQDQLRDRLLEIAITGHLDRLAAEIHEMASAAELAKYQPDAVLLLLGHLRLPGFQDEIGRLWSLNEELLLPHVFWAAARCPLADVGSLLDRILDRLATLPKRSRPQDLISPRERVLQQLCWAFRRGISPQAVAHLIARAQRDEELRSDIAWLLDDVDHPDAVEFAVRQMAERGGIHLGKNLTGVGDSDPETHPLTPESLVRLKELWERRSEPDRVRTLAFTMWLRAGGCHDPGVLRSVDRTEPYYVYALQHRVKLGDRSAEDEVIAQLRAKTWGDIWWQLAHRVWGERLQQVASETLAALKDTIPTDFKGGFTDDVYHLSDMLVKIPVAAAEQLLREHWGHLQYSPRMIQVALRLATPDCQALAREAILRCPADVDVFHHAFSGWERGSTDNPLSARHLSALEPYLDRMTEKEKLFLAWAFERASDLDGEIARWLRQHIVPHVSPEERRRVRVADEHFLDELDRQFHETRFRPFAVYEFREPANQHDFPRRQIGLLDEWLKTHASFRGLQIAAAQIAHLGSREDISLLTKYAIEGPPEEVASVIADASLAIRRRVLS